MPVLKNAKHEKFAHGLADGKSQEQAYIDAGFSPKAARSCAARLCKQNANICQRRDEILLQRKQAEEKAREKAIERSGWDKARILSALGEVVMRCMQHTPVLNAKGEQVFTETPEGALAAAYTFDSRGANTALRTIAQMEGLLVNTHEIRRSPLDGLPPEIQRQIRDRAMAALQQRGWRVIDGSVVRVDDAAQLTGSGS